MGQGEDEIADAGRDAETNPFADTQGERGPVEVGGPAGIRTDWFATTHWSVVVAAQESGSPAALQALERLCQAYWYPLYVFVRRRGYSPENAQDLTQAFFERLLEKDYVRQVARENGRFRAFLLAALKHFLSDQRDRERALKRGGGQALLSLDAQVAEDRYQLEPIDAVTPDRLFERRWAFTVLEQARARLRDEFADAGKSELYEHLKGVEAGEGKGLRYAEVGRRFSLSESAVKSAALRLRRRYGELVREEIAQTVATASEIDEEVRHLLAVIAG